MNDGLIFQDFKEAPINFKPTFKFDVGTDDYDTRYGDIDFVVKGTKPPDLYSFYKE